MKLSNLLKILVIGVVSITLPMAQAYAVVPDVHSVLSETMESTSSDSATDGSQAVSEPTGVATDIPAGDLAQPSAVIPADVFEQTSAPEELETLGDDQDEAATALLLDQDHHGFWTKRKILTTSLLLGLLLLLAGGGSVIAGSGGGGGGFFGFGGGGSSGGDGCVGDCTTGDNSTVPHHPEPSTLLLLGLGLLVPFFRKRSA